MKKNLTMVGYNPLQPYFSQRLENHMSQSLITLPPNERWILIAVILLIVFVVRGLQYLAARGKSSGIALGAQRDYGLAGGSICPKCQRAIQLSLLSLKLGLGTRLVRCEFCGKWSMVRRRSMAELRAAEAAELAVAQPAEPVREKSAEEKLKEMVENSRYIQ
jgi:hypothetical protein